MLIRGKNPPGPGENFGSVFFTLGRQDLLFVLASNQISPARGDLSPEIPNSMFKPVLFFPTNATNWGAGWGLQFVAPALTASGDGAGKVQLRDHALLAAQTHQMMFF